jgi:16S rRNA (cytosine1402-N4)-methyltransferase
LITNSSFSATQVFQAIRIAVNDELGIIERTLPNLPKLLNPGGRVAILTFHSGEDRLVKKSFKELKKNGVYSDISEDVTRPSAEECRLNPRSKSTKMRWAIKA